MILGDAQILRDSIAQETTVVFDELPHDLLEAPCEVQLCGYYRRQDLHVVFGTCVWNTTTLGEITPRINGIRMLDKRGKYYPYMILRRPVTAEPYGIEYTYILPPSDFRKVVVNDDHSRATLLALEDEISIWAAEY